MNEVKFRDAIPTDEKFVNDVTKATMNPYVEATWGSDCKRKHYYDINKFQQHGTTIIQLGGYDVGRMTVTRKCDVIILDEIHILPEYQGRGVGAEVIQRLLTEATEKQLPVELFILKLNPAKRLYDRLGFKVCREDAVRYYMKRDV